MVFVNKQMMGPRLNLVILAVALAGCGGKAYVYESVDTDRFMPTMEQQSEGPIRVSTSAPGRDETARIFGIDLYAQGIQPVWLQIENTGKALARYAPVSTDPEYFAPLEVAYTNRSGFSKESRRAIDERFHDLAMPRYVDAGESRSGFVFTHADPGAKGFNVDVFAGGETYSFTFLLRVPGFEPDYAKLNLGEMYTGDDVPDYESDALKEAIRNLPCCSGIKPGDESGEAINLVLIGESEQLLRGLLRSGWRETSVEEAATLQPRYLFGRQQDAIFRYETIGGDGFYELRFWKAPFRSDSEAVYVGLARHYFRWLGNLTRLDADLDNARNFAAQKFLYGQVIKSSAWIAGEKIIPAVTFWDTVFNTSYFTDGYRYVTWLSGEPLSIFEIDLKAWDEPPRWTQR
jgi:hypothetical protein